MLDFITSFLKISTILLDIILMIMGFVSIIRIDDRDERQGGALFLAFTLINLITLILLII